MIRAWVSLAAPFGYGLKSTPTRSVAFTLGVARAVFVGFCTRVTVGRGVLVATGLCAVPTTVSVVNCCGTVIPRVTAA